MVCTKHVIHLPKRQWSKWILLWRSCPFFPFKQKRWLRNKSDRLLVLNALGFRRRQVIQDVLGFWIPFQWNLDSWISDSTSKNFSHCGMRIPLHGASSGRWKPVVSIQTQAVKLHNYFVHFKCSLRVNKKNILGEYLRSLTYKELFYIWNKRNDLYWNTFVSKRLVTRAIIIGSIQTTSVGAIRR